MTTHDDSTLSGPLPRWAVRRRAAAMALVVLATAVATVMLLAVWAHSFLLDTDRFVTVLTPVLKDPRVTLSVGDLVAKQTVSVTHAERHLDEVLPARIRFISAPLVRQLEELIADNVTASLRSEKGLRTWEAILRFTHRQVIAVLTDDSRLLRIHGDEVRLDLIPLIVTAVRKLDQLLPSIVSGSPPLLSLTAGHTLEEQRDALAAALGRPLDPDFGQVTLFRNAQLSTAQRALRLFDILVYVLVGLTGALVAAALLVSPHRRRITLLHLGVGVVVAMVLSRIAVSQTEAAMLDSAAAASTAAPIIDASVTAVFASLHELVLWMLAGGVAVALAAYLLGQPAWLAHSSTRLVAWTSLAKHRVAASRGPAADWVRRYRDALRVGGGAVFAALALLFASCLTGAIVILVAAALFEWAVTWLARSRDTP